MSVSVCVFECVCVCLRVFECVGACVPSKSIVKVEDSHIAWPMSPHTYIAK